MRSKQDQSRIAVVVVDPQKDYCVPHGVIGSLGYSVEGRATVAVNISGFVEEARKRVQAVFFVRTEVPAWGRSPALKRQYARTSLKREPDASLGDWYGVHPAGDDIVMTKAKYSAFRDTGLDAGLRALEINTVVLCGFTTEVCVDTTARDAFLLDYNVICVSDCMAGSTPERHETALGVIETFFGTVIDSADLLREL